MLFSQRIGKTPIRSVLQIESMDGTLKNRLWNVILQYFFGRLDGTSSYRVNESEYGQVCILLWTEFFNQRIDRIPKLNSGRVYTSGFLEYLEEWYHTKAEWYKIYDLLEFICQIEVNASDDTFVEVCNGSLAMEMAGYRIINSQIVQVTSEEEIVAIEDALGNSGKFGTVALHLDSAIKHLSNRENPDYRNSVKESISALEALCKILIGDEKATLGKALAVLEGKYGLHTSLKEAFSKIYGYSSDAGGIRHAMLEDSVAVDFDDAKFMLVLCSSFINYLRAKFKE